MGGYDFCVSQIVFLSLEISKSRQLALTGGQPAISNSGTLALQDDPSRVPAARGLVIAGGLSERQWDHAQGTLIRLTSLKS